MNDKKTAKISFNQQSAEFPIYSGTLGYDVIDVKTLGDHGIYTMDAGFYSTAACESKITFVDGEKGVLLYRGYPIDQLANQCDYLEVCYLLMYAELPNAHQKERFVQQIKDHTSVYEHVAKFFNGFHHDAHPMAMVLSTVGALSAFYHDALDIRKPDHRELSAIRLVAKMPTLAAMNYKYSIGQHFIRPRQNMSYAENFLHMMFGTPAEEKKPNPILARAMDRIFTLHADHEQNASTTTVDR